MTDAELSRQLALAIGWPENAQWPAPRMAAIDGGGVQCWTGSGWRHFDYRDPAVIWPIAERYNCFPIRHDKAWQAIRDGWHFADTAAEAVARAVVGALG